MAKPRSAITMWGQYIALRVATSLIHSFPINGNLLTASGIGRLLHRTNRKRRERAQTNLALSFPEWSSAEVNRVVERSMEHMIQLFMVDAVATPRVVTVASWPSYIQLSANTAPLLDRLLKQEPMVLVTGHVGNWELLGHFFAMMGYPVAAVARPIDNPLVNRWLLGIREATGTRIITKWDATSELQETITAGGRVAFIADQNAGRRGMFVPFFGRFASCYKSIGLLAMRYRVPVAIGFARRLNGELRYELHCEDIIEPEDWADQDDPLFYLTARYSRGLEMMIRSAPEQYFWLHRRWKSRPKHEEDGKPVPPALVEKLRGLPWMTEPELERLIANSNAGIGGATR